MELEIIKHSNISHEDLLRVICIKNVAWPHSFESQLKWIEENQNPEDLHILLKDGINDYAYMDLCPVKAIVDGIETAFMGIGNVCSKTKGQGYGGVLLNLVNKYLIENDFKGLLFCKNHVKSFYTHYNWQVIPSENVTFEKNGYDNIYTLTFNMTLINQMFYNDRLF